MAAYRSMRESVASQSNEARMRLHQRQGDSVIKAFKILISKYNPSGAQDPFDRRVESDPLEQVEEKEGSLHQLRFDFLPLLDDQIVSLLRSLDLTRLRKEPMLALELISDIQSELDQTLDSIQYAISITCPKPHASSSDRLNDQHLKDFKLFRVDGLHHMFITNVMESVIPMFRLSYRLLQQLKLSTKEYKYATRINRTKKSIVEHGTSSCNEIQSTLGWVEDSEFDTIRFGWPDQADLIDDQLEQISRLINQEPHYVEEYFREVTLSKQVMELAKSIVPIVKLSRLFLNKLSAQGIDRKLLPMHTGMRSDQVDSLSVLAASVRVIIDRFITVLTQADTNHRAATRVTLKHSALRLEELFQSSLLLICFHLVPSIQNGEGDYLKTWFTTWSDQLSWAIQNLDVACQYFQDRRT
ncbi:hypothetical protein MJO28_015748 [Puccinia striiformis f. sp. tritici]|uniref:Uncharacterized protein n=3 Tax=Puccinia striiformis TaxID=27350 RepID=A0A0L0UUD2_9BASI|nr:hypothetical protein Pst134EA_029278 [Puccinia striiformis f. sp. tritici]KAI9623960.1 hypothetical protein KEM48_009185 [Puccinia striiformis f. sp. tritici PST-130]KNE90364.1 hypothetical protein PSTG_16187 [Puccinia striiformis f. sp. tritici PST-78]POW16669.1 hypothetical protein PSTT_01101 [Puccinia striiformis]KAH9441274.1 hypothetical protein Pst134EB_029937 [Puccinia striiformis f. sp. tritici]KAH9447245.1 hypothetical protein Pst134EA_029278 [Puccinia striiformis f. sp. tritici]